ncbi:MAG TPA: serine hydrolase domain-containing protein [Candidatus Dormibacteraeota bacterium]|nr:serine hydrolase domain-containing protein [Candidatus Dormibacteraeota bacterium]
MDSVALDRALELVRARKTAAQLCVLREGQVVLDRSFGCPKDALFLIYSASKPFVALLVHLLAQRGMLSLDDSVAAYWPEYGQRGKGAITVRHVLQHRAGVPVAGSLLRTVLHMSNWDLSVRDAEQTRPRWAAGQVAAYHFITYGFILGELVRRVTGVPVRDFLRSELLAPLGLDAVWLGLPDELWPRRVRVRAGHPSEWINQVVFNRRKIRQAVIPAAGISATARQLARLYKMLLMGGELDGVRLLEERTIAEARQPSSDGEVDAFINRPVRWAQGFQLGGPGSDPRDMSRVMGGISSRQAFGHAGNASCVTWADPTRRLVFVYLMNLQPGIDEGFRHLGEVSDAVLAACN